ncbi:TPA: ketoacyl-ACP synthase III [Candidatus Bipolaricaulota bacterium]|nr:ketoacyl-ACP synthase III [Candidatus Bipolaricaulota bacterium]
MAGPSPGIVGIGASVPNHRLTNRDLERMVETSDEWIIQRTGIKERRILGEDEDPTVLGVEAAEGALVAAGLALEEIDLVITAANVQLMPVPGSSALILEGLRRRASSSSRSDSTRGKEIPFFDLVAGCTGFIYALEVARRMFHGGHRHILVIGLEALSRFTNWKERETCVLFGDGAGAVVLGPVGEGRGILASYLAADCSKWALLRVEAGGTKLPADPETISSGQHFLKMEGRGVFEEAVRMMERASLLALERAGLKKEEVDWFVPHQANLRIIKAFAKRLRIPWAKILVNIERYGNTSTASIPLALDEAVKDNRLREGDLVVLTGFGAGVTYGANVIRW